MRTQVAIIGAGPAGLTLAHLLHREGIESVILEARSREYVEGRVRAGLLEHGTVELLTELGLADRLDREALVHHGIELRFDGTPHRIPLTDLTGRNVYIYGQQEMVKDLIAAWLSKGGRILFDAEATAIEGLKTDKPAVRYLRDGQLETLECDAVAGCDGFHGVSRQAMPANVLREYVHDYPFGWLGILARVAPSTEELIYASHERGFALHTMRSPQISRLYLQVTPDEDIANWPVDRIWDELQRRFETRDGWRLKQGPIIEKGITPMRSYVAEPMQYGRLFLAGDAAHIVPPTGAKGLNLAVADVRVLAPGLVEFFRTGATTMLDSYSDTCLKLYRLLPTRTAGPRSSPPRWWLPRGTRQRSPSRRVGACVGCRRRHR